MNEAQKDYLKTKICDIQSMLEEKEQEKKTMSAGFSEIIKLNKKKVSSLLRALQTDDDVILHGTMYDDELEKFLELE